MNHKLTNVRWAEVGNEPNGTATGVTLEAINILYRALNAQLVARGLRDDIQLMAAASSRRSNTGTRSHYEWLKWIGANMNDVVDAYAEHVYWWYDKPGRLETGCATSTTSRAKVLPEARKPMYMIEYGIRWLHHVP